MKLKYLSHSSFLVDTGKYQILIDPFIEGNPSSKFTVSDFRPQFIVLTHAHGDHLGSAIEIAKKSDSLIIAVNELANYVASLGLKAHNMHIGGSYNFDFGKLKFTIAHHGSSSPDGRYMGEPAGVLLFIDNKILYHAGDTGLFYDMKLIGELNPIDIAMLPIGDNFTMGIDDAVKAVEFIKPKLAIPMHYNTFPVIQVDPNIFAEKVNKLGIKGKVMQFGEVLEL